MMTIEEMIEVLKAYKDGKTIEVKAHYNGDLWGKSSPRPLFNFANFDYRVKPEPRQAKDFWIGFDGNGHRAVYDEPFPGRVHTREVLNEKEALLGIAEARQDLNEKEAGS